MAWYGVPTNTVSQRGFWCHLTSFQFPAGWCADSFLLLLPCAAPLWGAGNTDRQVRQQGVARLPIMTCAAGRGAAPPLTPPSNHFLQSALDPLVPQPAPQRATPPPPAAARSLAAVPSLRVSGAVSLCSEFCVACTRRGEHLILGESGGGGGGRKTDWDCSCCTAP